MKTLAFITLLIALTNEAAQTPKRAATHIDPEVEAAVMKVLDEIRAALRLWVRVGWWPPSE